MRLACGIGNLPRNKLRGIVGASQLIPSLAPTATSRSLSLRPSSLPGKRRICLEVGSKISKHFPIPSEVCKDRSPSEASSILSSPHLRNLDDLDSLLYKRFQASAVSPTISPHLRGPARLMSFGKSVRPLDRRLATKEALNPGR